MHWKLGRRPFLSSLFAAGAGLIAPNVAEAAAVAKLKGSGPLDEGLDGSPIVPIRSGLGSTGNIYEELGLTPMRNVSGTLTVIGGSLMKPEVMELMRLGNQHFVFLDELEIAAGKFIAKLCKSPAGYTGLVTGGCAAAILTAYAAMMTEDIEPRMEQIPDVTGFAKTEVIIQKSHRNPFDHQIRQTGAKLVEVETREEMIAAINPRTLAIHFTNILSGNGKVSGPETVAIAKEHGLYTFCDASADVPPVSRLWEYPAVGFDVVAFSGGKDICGPSASGVVIGKEQLVRWMLLNMSPQEDRIARPCKVGKEVVFGLLKALEIFVNQNEDETMKMYDARAKTITDAVAKYGVVALPKVYDPKKLGGDDTPHYQWQWEMAKIPLTNRQVLDQLAMTKPVGIGYILPTAYAGSEGMRGRQEPGAPPKESAAGWRMKHTPIPENVLDMTMWVLKEGEDKIVATRLAEIFAQAKKS